MRPLCSPAARWLGHGENARTGRGELYRRCFAAALVAVAAIQLYRQATGHEYGYDFQGGTWAAGRALLNGRSPFPIPDPSFLKAHSNGFITPPPLALLAVPFSLLPFGAAIVIFNLVCMAGLAGALRLLDEHRPDVFLVFACSFPSIASLCLGQPDGLFALAAAAAWQYRGTWRGSLAAATIIAAKLLAWPLILWLIATRRYRQAALTGAFSLAILAVAWAFIGFDGLAAYPRLLAADAHAFGIRAHSILTALWRFGVPLHLAMPIALAIALAIAALVFTAGGRTDLGTFTAALTLGIFASPVVWQHYFMLLFVPLAATRRARDPVAWGLLALLWLSPTESPGTLGQALAIPIVGATLAIRVAFLSRAVTNSSGGESATTAATFTPRPLRVQRARQKAANFLVSRTGGP